MTLRILFALLMFLISHNTFAQINPKVDVNKIYTIKIEFLDDQKISKGVLYQTMDSSIILSNKTWETDLIHKEKTYVSPPFYHQKMRKTIFLHRTTSLSIL